MDMTLPNCPHSANSCVIAVVRDQTAPKLIDARSQDHQSDIERKEAGFRPFRSPADTDLNAAGDHDQRE